MKVIELFTKGELDAVLRGLEQQLHDKIYNEDEAYLLNVNEQEFIDHLVSEFTLDTPVIDFNGASVSDTEKMIPAEYHPSHSFWVEPGKEYRRHVVIYHLPFQGDTNLLEYIPNPRILWTTELQHALGPDGEFLSFEVINFTQDAEDVKRRAGEVLRNLQTQLNHIRAQVEGYNSGLRLKVEEIFKKRKEDLKSKGDFLTSLGVPIRKRANISETFAVPTPKIPKKIVPKPVATTTGKKEPTLDTETYEEILQVIHDVGKAIERMPSTYKGKLEEDMRDHLLMVLEPRFEGSATGETFNKSGKTDILLKYQNSNIFIAECKYWDGEEKYLNTIDQILKYLTWRDSKAAIVLFVKNKDFSKVIEVVKNTTPRHPNYLTTEGEKEETWLKYSVHLNEDKGRKIYLAVLLFHFPETDI